MKKIGFIPEDPNDPIANMDEDEFIDYVANDCIANMSEEDKQCFKENKDPYDHHFGYGMYIRNTYIHGKNLPFYVLQADSLSHSILEKIISIINADDSGK